jgi:cytochrome c553
MTRKLLTTFALLALTILPLCRADSPKRAAPASPATTASPATPATEPARLEGAPNARALLTRYCVECHNEKKTKGKLNLAVVGHDPARPEFANLWRQGIGRVRQLEMPLEDAPQPTPAERAALVEWMQWNLDRATDAAPPVAGRVTARRLNRLEYRNTIRDLVGITFDPLTFDPTRDFPADGAGYGFDNIGDVLSVSPLHMEQYLSAAEQILDRAIVIEGLDGPRTRRFEAKELRVAGMGSLAGSDPAADRWTPRAWSADIDLRQGGEYFLRCEIASEQANRKQAQMAFLLDSGKQEKFTITREGKVARTERRVKLAKGPQQIAIAYLHEQNKPNFEPADDDKFTVSYLELVGPVGLFRDAAPATHRVIFVAYPGTGKSRRQAAGEIVAAFAARAFRRPVLSAEVERYLKLFDAADVDGETFEAAVRVPLTAILVSPHFLYRVEPDRAPQTPGGDYALNDFELASRLSYFIWSSMPDAELLRVAGEGRLADPVVLEAQARRMIADPKADMLADAFATQWLQIRGVETLPQPDPKQFSKLGTALKDAMRAEPVLLFQHVLRNGLPLTDLLDAKYTFLNEELAKQYGITGVTGKQMRLVQLNDARRGGVLTMAGVLAVTSHPDRTSPVRRGKWILDAILGAPPPPPPPDVGELPPATEVKDGKPQQVSLRQRLELHRTAASCAACHKRMDPLGFALENFDAVGRWRDKDNKLPVDASASLPDGRAVNGPMELKRLLVGERDALATCLSEKLLTFALGRGVEDSDRPVIAQLARATATDGYRLDRMIVEIVKSRPFRYRQGPQPLAPATTQPTRNQ